MMNIAIGSDEQTTLTHGVLAYLREKEHTLQLCGALRMEKEVAWPHAAKETVQWVLTGSCAFGILFCWTGTGVSMAANRFCGIRAALCADAQTAQGARQWNDANVLVMSSRYTSVPVAIEILQAWMHTDCIPDEMSTIALLDQWAQTSSTTDNDSDSF